MRNAAVKVWGQETDHICNVFLPFNLPAWGLEIGYEMGACQGKTSLVDFAKLHLDFYDNEKAITLSLVQILNGVGRNSADTFYMPNDGPWSSKNTTKQHVVILGGRNIRRDISFTHKQTLFEDILLMVACSCDLPEKSGRSDVN